MQPGHGSGGVLICKFQKVGPFAEDFLFLLQFNLNF